MSAPNLTEHDFVEYRSEHNVYQNYECNRWYVPRKEIMCMECIGKGYSWEYNCITERDEKEECLNCLGTGRVEFEDFDNALNQDEYESETRQYIYLEKRYGYRPTHIQDYWVRERAE